MKKPVPLALGPATFSGKVEASTPDAVRGLNSRDVGAPKDCRLLIYFGKSKAVRIDTDSIAETFER
jgi:hypothetical protein